MSLQWFGSWAHSVQGLGLRRRHGSVDAIGAWASGPASGFTMATFVLDAACMLALGTAPASRPLDVNAGALYLSARVRVEFAVKPTRVPSHPNATVLVVEDNVIVRATICDVLRDEGFRVLEASSVEEALKLLNAVVVVHVILIDLHLPGSRDGLDLARIARQQFPATRIVLTSGKVPASTVPDLADLGPFLRKPYLISRVVDLIRDSVRQGTDDG
jgi:CheY-like chemotaxis protein